jgi:hypothetical protein
MKLPEALSLLAIAIITGTSLALAADRRRLQAEVRRLRAALRRPAPPPRPAPIPASERVVVVAEPCGCVRYLKPSGGEPCGRHERIHHENSVVRELDRQFRGPA